ncbi:MAG TPA: tyrosine-type recombinase/integrase [Bryobacteraceae bacterium]|nr:tyrosine-type recombinase/integrase [Bryobacteraceae bacterium]
MTGTITKRARKGGKPSWGYYFVAGIDAAGKRVQATKSGFETKKEASEALRDAIADFEAKRDAGPVIAVPAFAAFFERWMTEHAGRKCSPKTVERYRELGAYAIRQTVDIAGVQMVFGGVALDRFGPMQMELTINALRDRGGQKTKDHPDGRPLSPKTVRHIACVIHGCLEKAVIWQLIERNPMDGIELPRLTRKAPRVVEKGGVTKLLARARDTRLYPLILLGLATGARRGELLALQWTDIDFKSGLMNVSKSLEQTKAGLRVKSTKSEAPRRFAVPPTALAALEEHRAEQDRDRSLFAADYRDNELVFCRPEGGYYSPDRVGARIVELMRKTGLEGVSLHSLRHTHASELLSSGVPIPTVAKRLGHANANITLSIYAHALEADELAAAKIWDDAMVDVIGANKRQPKRNLAKSSAARLVKSDVIEIKAG